MAVKYYAVKKGLTPGIYMTWDECKAQVDGFSGAIYKSFRTKEEALAFIGIDVPETAEDRIGKSDDRVNGTATKDIEAYVDGSYNPATGEYSYGMVILQGDEELKYNKKMNDPDLASMRNVAGEIKGAEAAMQYAIDNGCKSVVIYYDYQGIESWCTGAWKTNKEGTVAYKNYYDDAKKLIDIKFVKVAGHSNNKYNDIADALAKEALNII